MPINVQGPDGAIIEFPDGTAPDVMQRAMQDHYGTKPAPLGEQSALNGLSDSSLENARAGMGKSFVDTGRGLAQLAAMLVKRAAAPASAINALVGNPDPLGGGAGRVYDELKQSQGESDRLSAPLMDSKAGLAGNVAGYATQFLGPGLALKGLNAARGTTASPALMEALLPTTYRASAIQGGALGAAQPISDQDSELTRLKNVGLGALTGGIGQAIPRVVGGVVRGARSLIDPFLESGQQRIVANALARFGKGGSMAPVASSVPGVQPTMAEATGNAGLGQLQRALKDSDSAMLNQFVERQLANNGARVDVLRGVAKTPDDLAAAIAQRDDAANALYGRAASSDAMRLDLLRQAAKDEAEKKLAGYGGIRAADATESNMLRASPELEALAQRPGFQQAIQQAQKLASDHGLNIGDPLKSVQGLHYVKLALDDMMQPNAASAMGRNQQSALQGTKQALLGEIENISPLYAQAKDVYQQMSGPVNQMQLGQELLGRSTSSVLDPLGNPTLSPAKYSSQLGRLDELARKATGFKGAEADKILSPDQLGSLAAVKSDLERQAVGDYLGKSAGSNTVQNLASQSLLGEITGGLGVPGLAESSIVQRIMRPIDTGYRLFGIPDELKAKLGSVLLNPSSPEAQAVLGRMKPEQRAYVERALAPYLGGVGQAARVGVSQ